MVLRNVSAGRLDRLGSVFLTKREWDHALKIQKQQGDPKQQKLAHTPAHQLVRKLRSDCSISSNEFAQNNIAW